MTTTLEPTTLSTDERRDAFIERFIGSISGAFDVFTMYLGDQLGFYEALAGSTSMTPGELAAHTGTHERYVREWLEQQAVTGVLEVENPDAPAGERRFALPAGHDEVLTDRESLNYLIPLAQALAGAVAPLGQLLDAFRTGAGVPYAAYGRNLREGQGRVNRPMFLHQLGQEYLPAIPDVDARLRAGGRVADIGCGVGWSSIGIARAYPNTRVDGFDLDAPSVEDARANAQAYDIADRVHFQHRDAADIDLQGQYDLVTAFECIHDLGNPVAALTTMRRLLKPGGTVVIADERVRDAFVPEKGDVEWMMYGWSVLHCLPVGVADCDGHACAATGTVMRPGTLERYAREAGFSRMEILPLENDFFYFYQLHP